MGTSSEEAEPARQEPDERQDRDGRPEADAGRALAFDLGDAQLLELGGPGRGARVRGVALGVVGPRPAAPPWVGPAPRGSWACHDVRRCAIRSFSRLRPPRAASGSAGDPWSIAYDDRPDRAASV